MEEENNDIEENIEEDSKELEEEIPEVGEGGEVFKDEMEIEPPLEDDTEEPITEEDLAEIIEEQQKIDVEAEDLDERDTKFPSSMPSEEGGLELDEEISELSDEERDKRIDREFHKNQIEASLFVAGRPLGLEELSVKLEVKKDTIKDLIQEIAFEYLDRTTSIEIVQIGDKYSMQIKPEYTERVSKFAAGGLIPESIMRTLTIIALKQPILKSMVIKLRGSGAYEHIKWLIDNDFLSAVKKGRTFELTTAQKFAETFGFSTNIEEMKKQMISQLEGKQ